MTELLTGSSIDFFQWPTHKDWGKMLEESLSLFQRGHGEHVIRSLVIIDRKSLDTRLSYWKLLAKLRGGSRFVIGYELCCLYDTRLYLDDWDDSSPAVHLQRVCAIGTHVPRS